MNAVIIAASGSERSVDFNSLKIVAKGAVRAERESFPLGIEPVKLLKLDSSGGEVQG